MTRQAFIILCWIIVAGGGVFLRFENLSRRPFHADEATGSRITAGRMASGSYRFDPQHYHGPTLSRLAMPVFEVHHESRSNQMSKLTPRLLTASAGSLLLLLPWMWRSRLGDWPTLIAAAFLATSPLLVYYSRMFVHEMLLVLFGLLALACITRVPRYGWIGWWIGLMFATKETFAISIIAWMVAGAAVVIEKRKDLKWDWWKQQWREYRGALVFSGTTAAGVSLYFYTDGFSRWVGALDAIKTFFVYETVAGHDKPFGYYMDLLVMPFQSGGFWWFGTPVAALALLAYGTTFLKNAKGSKTVRFIAYAAVGHFIIYSLIRYKTTWLACLPWAHVCLLAGFGLAGISHVRSPIKAAIGVVVAVALLTQIIQARRATGRLETDERNPFAYVPTRKDIEEVEVWLGKLAAVVPGKSIEPIGVVGADYWPLPWYLRKFEKVGYWPNPVAELDGLAVVFAMPEVEAEVGAQLSGSHIRLPRGLRAGVPVMIFVRNDLWAEWMKEGN